MFWPLVPVGSLGNDTAIKLAGLLTLAAILYGAVRAGLREQRIPNQLVLIGVAAGVLLHTVLPGGNGFLTAWPGGVGPWQSLLGLAIGAIAMFPFYRMGAIGAGHVKLMAAVGAILGPADIVPAILGTLLAGGVVALAVIEQRRCRRRLLGNLAALLGRAVAGFSRQHAARAAAIRPVAEVPYVVAMALGTLGGVLWVLSGA